MSNANLSQELKSFLANLTSEPGVYKMLSANQEILYVGKAANLKKRVSSYFNKQNKTSKLKSLVSQIVSIEVNITKTETEALLLESSLIKSLQPKYNVLMRDDKTYPFIYIPSNNSYPNILVKRCKGKPKNSSDFFGPYPSVTAVHETVNMIQKIFKVRSCTDSYFNARSRPCLQYQIKRCSAPCTNYISEEDYNSVISDVKKLLRGKSQELLDDLASKLQECVNELNFENAAVIRDRIKSLRLIQEQQGVVKTSGDADVIVILAKTGFACVQLVEVRNGEILSCDSFFPNVPEDSLSFNDEELWQQVFNSFVAFYYLYMPDRIPSQVFTDQEVVDKKSLEDMLYSIKQKKCSIKIAARGKAKDWLLFAMNNLQISVAKYNASTNTMKQRYHDLGNLLGVPNITRMECFDISHTQGDSTVAACVVFGEHGPSPRDYRQFNISGITKGDDYAAMEQAILRRFKQLKNLPDVLIIDGGKGQVEVAKKSLAKLQIFSIYVLGIAKGKTRKACMERILLSDNKTGSTEITLPTDSKALHLLNHIRDESHRFAITAHRKKRAKKSLDSSLDHIEGIGPKRKKALLQRFGGYRELAKASIDELVKVQGISEALAKIIYENLHL
ncbi:MAG: excinuclease ABC subunit C [Legionellales bacterium RIFCSPHIGHO2_12_FULL_35_11]|nr:MAG: excinuclease ABC subunit C [Legionellales bacterium RIFCSPHIGHO2_12_FULL_35_11]